MHVLDNRNFGTLKDGGLKINSLELNIFLQLQERLPKLGKDFVKKNELKDQIFCQKNSSFV